MHRLPKGILDILVSEKFRLFIMFLLPALTSLVVLNAEHSVSEGFTTRSCNVQERPYALRWYPSAHLPPIREPYIFHWYQTPPEFPGAISNSVLYRKEGPKPWIKKKVLPLDWFCGPQCEYWHSVDKFRTEYKKYAYIDLEKTSTQKGVGIAVDEWQAPQKNVPIGHPLHERDPYGIKGSIQGIIDAKHVNPALFIAVYWRGEDSIAPILEKRVVDLVMIEGAILKRGQKAREFGYLDKTIFMLGYLKGSENLATIEARVKTIREKFPEMPGLAFFDPNLPRSQTWRRKVDKMLYRYFIKPAPKVSLNVQKLNQSNEKLTYRLEADAKAQNGRRIKEFRWFIDNRLVAVTKQPQYELDVSQESQGQHTLTVHAVDNEWNRSATQKIISISHKKSFCLEHKQQQKR